MLGPRTLQSLPSRSMQPLGGVRHLMSLWCAWWKVQELLGTEWNLIQRLQEGFPKGRVIKVSTGGGEGVGQLNRERQNSQVKERTHRRPKFKRAHGGLGFQKLDFLETGRSPLCMEGRTWGFMVIDESREQARLESTHEDLHMLQSQVPVGCRGLQWLEAGKECQSVCLEMEVGRWNGNNRARWQAVSRQRCKEKWRVRKKIRGLCLSH